MWRNMVETIGGRPILGTPFVGLLAEQILAETATGTHGPGLLYNDGLVTGKRYRLVLQTAFGSDGVVRENGSFSVTAPASTTYLLYEDNLLADSTPTTVAVGSVTALTVAVAGAATFAITATGSVSATLGPVAIAPEPITMDEAKSAARIADSAFDDQLLTLIAAARRQAEQETGRDYVRKTTRYTFTDWPAADCELHVFQAVAVTISYWSESGWLALPDESFAFFELGNATGIAPAIGTAWPALAPVPGGPRVRVDLTAGPEDPASADPCVKLYIKSMVAYWIDNPCAAAPGTMTPAPFLSNLLDPVRLWG